MQNAVFTANYTFNILMRDPRIYLKTKPRESGALKFSQDPSSFRKRQFLEPR